MRIPSNRIQRKTIENYRVWPSLTDVCFAVFVLAGFGWTLWNAPWKMLFIISICILFVCIFGIFQRRRDRHIASLRPNESICTFARTFDCRKIDTWIIRAVHEAFQRYVDFPLRASDRFDEDLCIDSDEVDLVAEEIALLISRPLHNSEQNPLYGAVETLADLVYFFSNQKRVPSALV